MVTSTGRRLPVPRAGTQVIPTGWSAAHSGAVGSTRTGTCAISHQGAAPTPGSFNATTGEYDGGSDSSGAPHWTGSCRVQKLANATTPEAAEETVILLDYLVTIELGVAPETRTGDVVVVLNPGTDGDPTLTDIRLIVADISRGTLAWERDLRCTEDQS